MEITSENESLLYRLKRLKSLESLIEVNMMHLTALQEGMDDWSTVPSMLIGNKKGFVFTCIIAILFSLLESPKRLKSLETCLESMFLAIWVGGGSHL